MMNHLLTCTFHYLWTHPNDQKNKKEMKNNSKKNLNFTSCFLYPINYLKMAFFCCCYCWCKSPACSSKCHYTSEFDEFMLLKIVSSSLFHSLFIFYFKMMYFYLAGVQRWHHQEFFQQQSSKKATRNYL